MGKKKQKIILPPELPPDVPDEEIEVSDEDLQFVNQHSDYAHFISKIDTPSLTKHVSRVADANEGALELLYEKKLRKKLENKETEENSLEVDPIDALPLKTPDGQLYYRRVVKEPKEAEDESKDGESIKDSALVKPTKAEKRLKFKKLRKEAKKQAKEEVQQTPHAEVVPNLPKFAELGTTLLADPESNSRLIKEMLEISKDGDSTIVILGLKSLLAVSSKTSFQDIGSGCLLKRNKK